MKANVDYNLLVQAERVRFQSDFSSAHWLHQVLSRYEQGMKNERRRLAFEEVIRIAVKFGCRAAQAHAETFPAAAGFPTYLNLDSPENWAQIQQAIQSNFDEHVQNRFRYVREGD